MKGIPWHCDETGYLQRVVSTWHRRSSCPELQSSRFPLGSHSCSVVHPVVREGAVELPTLRCSLPWCCGGIYSWSSVPVPALPLVTATWTCLWSDHAVRSASASGSVPFPSRIQKRRCLQVAGFNDFNVAKLGHQLRARDRDRFDSIWCAGCKIWISYDNGLNQT